MFHRMFFAGQVQTPSWDTVSFDVCPSLFRPSPCSGLTAGAKAAEDLVLQVLGQGHHYEHHHQNLVPKMPLTSWKLVESK